MKRLLALMLCAVSLKVASQSGDCCETPLIWNQLLSDYAVQCIEDLPVTCDDFATGIHAVNPCDGSIYEAVCFPLNNSPFYPNPCGDAVTFNIRAFDEDCGRLISEDFTVAIEDPVPPSIYAGPSDTVVFCDEIPDFASTSEISAFDNCSGDLTISEGIETVIDGESECDFELLREWTITDFCGNTSTWQQTISVNPAPLNPGCTIELACNYNPAANIDDSSCLYADALGVCGGDCVIDQNNNGICDLEELQSGCGPQACGLGTVWDEVAMVCVVASSCNLVFDGNLDGAVGSVDLLGLLSEYGLVCEPEVAFVCGDPVSYQGYDYATVLIADQCWFAENLRNELYNNGDTIPAGLSDSEWQNTTSGAVAVYGEDAGCDNYSPDIDACDPAQSLSEFGRLYNWYAVYDTRGLCPSGWHVPTDGEWMTLEMALGMTEAEVNSTGFRGTDQGTQMKTDYGWYVGGNETNASGFSGLPGGLRNPDGDFDLAGYVGGWWSSSPSGSYAWDRALYGSNAYVGRYNTDDLRIGLSIRCVKD